MRNRIFRTVYIEVLLIAMLFSLLSCSAVPEASVTLAAIEGGDTIPLSQESSDDPTTAASGERTTAPRDETTTESGDGSDKTVITIAGCGIIEEPRSEFSYLMTACRAYEDAHPEIDIQIIDYTQDYGYFSGPERLSQDLQSGEGADLYFYQPFDFIVDETQDFLDLSALIDVDSDFSTDDYYWNIAEDTSLNGGLYSLPLAFTVGVVHGPENLLCGVSDWSPRAAMALDDSLPDGYILSEGWVPSGDLGYYLVRSLDNYIDPETGKVNLESQDFYDLLDYVGRFAYYDEATMEKAHSEIALLRTGSIYGIQEYATLFLDAGEPQAIIGSPIYNGEFKATINHKMSISAISDKKDIAWDILKHFLSEDMQTMTLGHFETYVYGIPLNRKANEWQIDWFDSDPEAGAVSRYAPFREEYLAFVDSITSVERINRDTLTIVLEEAPAYFRGKMSAEELAKVLEEQMNQALEKDYSQEAVLRKSIRNWDQI